MIETALLGVSSNLLLGIFSNFLYDGTLGKYLSPSIEKELKHVNKSVFSKMSKKYSDFDIEFFTELFKSEKISIDQDGLKKIFFSIFQNENTAQEMSRDFLNFFYSAVAKTKILSKKTMIEELGNLPDIITDKLQFSDSQILDYNLEKIEVFFNSLEFKDAFNELETLSRKLKNDKKSFSKILLKKASFFYSLNKIDDANKILEHVIKNFPSSKLTDELSLIKYSLNNEKANFEELSNKFYIEDNRPKEEFDLIYLINSNKNLDFIKYKSLLDKLKNNLNCRLNIEYLDFFYELNVNNIDIENSKLEEFIKKIENDKWTFLEKFYLMNIFINKYNVRNFYISKFTYDFLEKSKEFLEKLVVKISFFSEELSKIIIKTLLIIIKKIDTPNQYKVRLNSIDKKLLSGSFFIDKLIFDKMLSIPNIRAKYIETKDINLYLILIDYIYKFPETNLLSEFSEFDITLLTNNIQHFKLYKNILLSLNIDVSIIENISEKKNLFFEEYFEILIKLNNYFTNDNDIEILKIYEKYSLKYDLFEIILKYFYQTKTAFFLRFYQFIEISTEFEKIKYSKDISIIFDKRYSDIRNSIKFLKIYLNNNSKNDQDEYLLLEYYLRLNEINDEAKRIFFELNNKKFFDDESYDRLVFYYHLLNKDYKNIVLFTNTLLLKYDTISDKQLGKNLISLFLDLSQNKNNYDIKDEMNILITKNNERIISEKFFISPNKIKKFNFIQKKYEEILATNGEEISLFTFLLSDFLNSDTSENFGIIKFSVDENNVYESLENNIKKYINPKDKKREFSDISLKNLPLYFENGLNINNLELCTNKAFNYGDLNNFILSPTSFFLLNELELFSILKWKNIFILKSFYLEILNLVQEPEKEEMILNLDPKLIVTIIPQELVKKRKEKNKIILSLLIKMNEENRVLNDIDLPSPVPMEQTEFFNLKNELHENYGYIFYLNGYGYVIVTEDSKIASKFKNVNTTNLTNLMNFLDPKTYMETYIKLRKSCYEDILITENMISFITTSEIINLEKFKDFFLDTEVKKIFLNTQISQYHGFTENFYSLSKEIQNLKIIQKFILSNI